jgi:hypothetical protein
VETSGTAETLRLSISVNVFVMSALVVGSITSVSMLLKLPKLPGPVAVTSVQLSTFE